MTEHLTYCPICREVIVRTDLYLLTRHEVEVAEQVIIHHFRTRHPRRYRIWCALGKRTRRPYRWLLGVA